MSPPRLLILGTGNIATKHAQRFAALASVQLAAAVDSVPGRAEAFATAHAIPHHFPTLEAALAWGQFDAAVNATPDAVHHPTTMALLAAGKPVFCEKPLAVNHADAGAMADAAERAGLVNMVNLTYRESHAIQRARALVAEGALGAVRHVAASYRQSWLTADHWGHWATEERWLWRLSKSHGSTGVLGDVGIHIVDFSTFAVGEPITRVNARLRTFPKAPNDQVGPYHLDANDSAILTVDFAGGALGTIHMSRFATGHANDLDLAIHGTTGALRVWSTATAWRLEACLGPDIQTQTWRELPCPPTPTNHDRFAEALTTRVNGTPDFRHAAAIQKVLDAAFTSDETGAWIDCG